MEETGPVVCHSWFSVEGSWHEKDHDIVHMVSAEKDHDIVHMVSAEKDHDIVHMVSALVQKGGILMLDTWKKNKAVRKVWGVEEALKQAKC